MLKIKSIWLYFPNYEEGSIVSYEVGKRGVTEIKKFDYCPAPYCTKIYYKIYKGNILIAEMYDISEVVYFETKGAK